MSSREVVPPDPTAAAAPPGGSMWRKLARLVHPWRWSLVLVAACIIASALARLVPPFVVRHVVNTNLVPQHTGGLVLAGGAYLLAVATNAGFTFLYSYVAARVSQSAIAELRVRLFAHEMALPASYFDTTPIGDVISRSTADVETVDELFTDGVTTLLGQLVPLIAIAAAMLFLSPLLTVVAAVAIPPLLLIVRFLQVRVRDAERETRLAVARLNVELAEVVGGVETIRAFGREQTFVLRFQRALRQTLLTQARSTGYNAFFAPLSGLFASIVIAVLLGVDIGTLIAFVMLFQSFFAPLIAIGDEWQSVQAAIAGAERVFEVLDLPTDGRDSPASEPTRPAAQRTPTPVIAVSAGVTLAHVSFGYSPAHPVLRNISLIVRPGEHVALVGRTGAGKSTVI